LISELSNVLQKLYNREKPKNINMSLKRLLLKNEGHFLLMQQVKNVKKDIKQKF